MRKNIDNLKSISSAREQPHMRKHCHKRDAHDAKINLWDDRQSDGVRALIC
jgi:hypothetical protein